MARPEYSKDVREFFDRALAQSQEIHEKTVTSGDLSYRLVIHSAVIAPHLKAVYTLADLDHLEGILKSTMQIQVSAQGFVQAADRQLDGKQDDTHYDAVWLRDTLWVYLGLSTQIENCTVARKLLSRMLDYLSSRAQMDRMKALIENPGLLSSKNAAMDVIHIRFDGSSENFDDVCIQGRPQPWNHKQNDALGLFYDLILRSLDSGEIDPGSLNVAHWEFLTTLPGYFSKMRFYEMEEAGPWEEIDRTNTSSIGLVTSSLETLKAILDTQTSAFGRILSRKTLLKKTAGYFKNQEIERLIGLGYKRIRAQLDAGGESPLYEVQSLKHRGPDASLYNLIFPARLKLFSIADQLRILAINEPLIGPVGIKRYSNDSYQSGNFWLRPHTDDTSSNEAFAERGLAFIRGTEAQWFFDSWLSVIYGELYQETSDAKFLQCQVQYFNRALAQITGGQASKKWLSANGEAVPALALPESYNSLVDGNRQIFVPSPITPLNWAKAALLLAFKTMRSNS